MKVVECIYLFTLTLQHFIGDAKAVSFIIDPLLFSSMSIDCSQLWQVTLPKIGEASKTV